MKRKFCLHFAAALSCDVAGIIIFLDFEWVMFLWLQLFLCPWHLYAWCLLSSLSDQRFWQNSYSVNWNTHATVLPPLYKSHFVSWHPSYTHTHPFNGPFPGPPRWAGTRKVKPIWILLKQETVSGSGINWAICKSAYHSRQITTPAPHHSVFYRLDALPATEPTVSKHWRHMTVILVY